MKSGKPIDVSKSSLVSLKAELLRKQEEAKKSKGSETYVRPTVKKKKELKVNPGIEERKKKDELSQEEVDLLQKSREVLEVKTKLYDKLQKGESLQENVGDPYLVDFKEKLDKVFTEDASSSSSKQKTDATEEEQTSDHYSDSDDDDEWVDYVDCLGRTRRCLKEDIEHIKSKDEEMRKMLGGHPEKQDTPDQQAGTSKEPSERELEMISNDMQREILRQKWEQQEELLLNKKSVYYEDIRFNEARTHGVAYYSFSTDEAKREEEQAEFKRQRDETLAKQKEAKEAKDRRDMMKQSRLIAARQRQRARLGLPPLSTDIDVGEKKEEEVKEEEPKKEEEDASAQDLEATLARAAHVRPWDIGKDGVTQKAKIMTQEEWIDKKRDERPEEFAPPIETERWNPATKTKVKKQKKKKGIFQGSSAKRKYEEIEDDEMPGPWPVPESTPTTSSFVPARTMFTGTKLSQSSQSTQSLSGQVSSPGPSTKGAAIPPPPTFDYYNPSGRQSKQFPKTFKSSTDMAESIEAGLEFLKKQSEDREKLLEKKGKDS